MLSSALRRASSTDATTAGSCTVPGGTDVYVLHTARLADDYADTLRHETQLEFRVASHAA